jgi:hypothetical protein
MLSGPRRLLMFRISLRTSSLLHNVDWNRERGPVRRAGSKLNRNGVKHARSMHLDKAPDSKFSYGLEILYLVRQMIPYSACFSSASSTSPHLSPLLVSVDNDGRRGCKIRQPLMQCRRYFLAGFTRPTQEVLHKTRRASINSFRDLLYYDQNASAGGNCPTFSSFTRYRAARRVYHSEDKSQNSIIVDNSPCVQ